MHPASVRPMHSPFPPHLSHLFVANRGMIPSCGAIASAAELDKAQADLLRRDASRFAGYDTAKALTAEAVDER